MLENKLSETYYAFTLKITLRAGFGVFRSFFLYAHFSNLNIYIYFFQLTRLPSLFITIMPYTHFFFHLTFLSQQPLSRYLVLLLNTFRCVCMPCLTRQTFEICVGHFDFCVFLLVFVMVYLHCLNIRKTRLGLHRQSSLSLTDTVHNDIH